MIEIIDLFHIAKYPTLQHHMHNYYYEKIGQVWSYHDDSQKKVHPEFLDGYVNNQVGAPG